MQTATIVSVLCTLACFHGAQAGFGLGYCPTRRNPMRNFDLGRYAGRWYEIASFGIFLASHNKCYQVNYTPNKEGGVDVKNVMVDKKSLLKKSMKSTAKPFDNSGSGWLITSFNYNGISDTANFWVLDTDYDNYAVASSCYDVYLVHFELGWILSRQPEMSEQSRNKVNQALAKNGLTPSQFAPIVQDCGPIE